MKSASRHMNEPTNQLLIEQVPTECGRDQTTEIGTGQIDFSM
jgi:hypothetical protein